MISKPNTTQETKTSLPVQVLVPLFLILMIVAPTGIASFPVLKAPSDITKFAAICFSPVLFIGAFVTLAGILSSFFQKAIIPGKFPRQVSHVIYGPRRLYGLCWGAVFYFTPVYYVFLSVPALRRYLFWMFGYRGHSDVTIAPDAWIRDLPLLKFGKGVYTANKCTIGTNICLATGDVLVDKITFGSGTMIGHLTMIAPGCKTGDKVEVGVGSGIGIRVQIGTNSRIGPTTTLNHGAQIGSNVDIGTMSYIGLKARIADGLQIPSGSVIPEGAEIKLQEDVLRFKSSESKRMEYEKENLSTLYNMRAE